MAYGLTEDGILRDVDLADWKCEKIVEQIREFESQLDDEHEVFLQLAGFGENVLFAVESITYQNPDILYFYGMTDGIPAQLIQHTSQLNFLLLSLGKPIPERPPRRIGFGSVFED